MNSILLILLGLLACLSAGHSEHRRVLNVFNTARQSVNPPCDYRGRQSPCNGQRKNSLPSLRWNSALAKASSDYAVLCPKTSNLNVPTGQAQLFRWSRIRGDTRSKEQTLIDQVADWSSLHNVRAFDPLTGVALGPDGFAYKTIVNAGNRDVGCAVNLDCVGGRVVVCTFGSAAPAKGPVYPILSNDAAVTNAFRDGIVTWANRARRLAYPRPSAPLQPVVWDDALAASAQGVANRQTSHPAVYDPALGNVQSVFSLNYIQVNPAFAFIATSFTRGVRYNLRYNTCRGQDGRCGLYTQLVGKDVSKIGCGLAWKNGDTFVVCQFDASYSNQGAATVRPY